MNKLLQNDIPNTDTIAITVKVIFGVFLLTKAIKTSVDIYYTIEDQKKINTSSNTIE